MKDNIKEYLILLIICSFLLTGCSSVKLDYTGGDLVFTVGSNDTKEINKNGAKVTVGKRQAFVRVDGDGVYDVYREGEHKIKKAKGGSSYKYYFISLDTFKDVEFKTTTPIVYADEEYGDIELHYFGNYTFQINNVDYFVQNYINGYLSINASEFISKQLIDELEIQINGEKIRNYVEILVSEGTIAKKATKQLESIGIKYSDVDLEDVVLSDYSQTKVDEIDNIKRWSALYVMNSTWIGIDSSELKFGEDTIGWYKTQNVYTDNYFSGKFEFFMGETALKYLTEDLKDFGITEAKVKEKINGNSAYSFDNFVVFDINYDTVSVDGNKGTPTKVQNPWYGFLVNNNTKLEVVNINTDATYTFNKK